MEVANHREAGGIGAEKEHSSKERKINDYVLVRIGSWGWWWSGLLFMEVALGEEDII